MTLHPIEMLATKDIPLEKRFFEQAIKSTKPIEIPKYPDVPGFRLRHETKQFIIETERKDYALKGRLAKNYHTAIWDKSKLSNPEDLSAFLNSLFACTCSENLEQAMISHYSGFQHLKNIGY